MQFIDLHRQYRRIQPRIDQALTRVLEHGQFIMGPEIADVEGRLAAFVGARHCIACSSGTDALLMPMMAAGIGPGDAVFTTPFSFFATAETISLLGATPVFVDIDPRTYNLDPAALQRTVAAVTREGRLRPRAIMAVDLYGVCADYEALGAVACDGGLLLIEDGAQAFGASYHGRRAPNLADVGATSFFPAKPLGCYGDGGAVFTNDDTQADIMRSIRIHGHGPDRANFVRIGLNARMDTLQAAVLIEKLAIYEDEIEARQRVAERYRQTLGGLPVTFQEIPDGCRSVYAQFCIETDHRAALQAALGEAGIPTAIHYARPMHRMDVYAHLGHGPGSLPVSERVAERILALPFHPYLEEAEIDRIGEIIGRALRAAEVAPRTA